MKSNYQRIHNPKDETCDKCKTIFKVDSKRVDISFCYCISKVTGVGESRGVDANLERTMLCENCAPTMDPGDIEFYFQFKSAEVVSVTTNKRIDDYK